MGDDRRRRIPFANRANAVLGELHMDITSPPPEIHFTARLLDHPAAQVLVRDKKNVAIGRSIFDDLHCIPARADDIRERLDPGTAINVGDYVVILVGPLLKELFQAFCRAGFRERTARF